MRTLPRVLSVALLVGAVLLGPATGLAFATTVEDLIKLKNAKVSDDVLIALIESDGSVFYLNADDIVALKQKGLSEKVITAMLETATKHRQAQQAKVTPATPPVPADTVVNDQYYRPVSAEPPTPVMLTVTQTNTQTLDYPSYATPNYSYPAYSYPAYTYPIAYGAVGVRQPVYWGFNGQRNPNAWGPTVQEQSLKPIFQPHGGVPVNQQQLIPPTPVNRGGHR